jgi:hypothetical protein
MNENMNKLLACIVEIDEAESSKAEHDDLIAIAIETPEGQKILKRSLSKAFDEAVEILIKEKYKDGQH